MKHLTERRFEKALPIFEKYRERLEKMGPLSGATDGMERELRELINTGYQSVKVMVKELSQKEEWVYLAADFMDDGDMTVMEFRERLGEIYNCDYGRDRHSDVYKTSSEVFWSKMPRLS